jgi:TonB-dependent receptor
MIPRFRPRARFIRYVIRLSLVTMSMLVCRSPLRAQGTATGTIEGRVVNPNSGSYLENAQLTIEGTSLATISDDAGFYRFTNVPAGTVTIRAFFTGLDAQTQVVTVAAGQTVHKDLALTVTEAAPEKSGATVRLAKYVVAESQQMDGAAIAINEQRFSPNMKVVVAADEFGAASEGDIGEFLKFLPGVSMDYLAGDARQVSLGGADFDYTPITFGGFGMTNSNQNGTNRGVSLEYVTLNNISRVEVINTPTPESPGAALAGSINFVPRTAFERSKPQLTFSTYLTMRDDRRDFEKSIGPREQRTRKVLPGVEFSYVVPVNRNFGFSVSGSASKSYSARDSVANVWRGGNAATNNTTFPDTTPDKPYLSQFTVRDGWLLRKRSSYSLTFDYRLSQNDRVSLSVTRSTYNTNYDTRALAFAINRVNPGNFDPSFTHGATGQGDLTISSPDGTRDRNTTTFMPMLVYRHDGPKWKMEGGTAYSRSRDHTSSADRGWFALTPLRRSNVTISFDDISSLRPGRIAVTDGTTGAPIDPFDINNYVVTTTNMPQPKGLDTKRSVYGNVRRDFDWAGTPVSLKAGVDLQNQNRDTSQPYPSNAAFTFVGADGRPSTTPVGNDDSAAPFFFLEIADRPGVFGFPSIPAISNTRLFAFYQSNPNYFRLDENAAYRAPITISKHAEETVYSAFLRGDVRFFQQRLKLVGGIRAEQTNVSAEGPLTDPTRNFQRRPDGSVILGSNGRPLPIATDALAISKLTYIERGAQVKKEYLRWFPSLNASFNVRENLVARVAYHTSIGRPNFNQYAGGITLPDTEADPSVNNRITVNNAAIKPWSAQTTTVALEYYFARVGTVSVSAYRREFENFFGTALLPATPEFLALYGLDEAVYGDYDVSTQRNIEDTVRMDGFAFNYKQALTFLPQWARGVQVFANASTQHASGGGKGEFQYSPSLVNGGISLTRRNYSLRIDVNHRGRQFVSSLQGRSIQADTKRFAAARTYIDITGEHVIWRGLRVFAKLRNVRDTGIDFEFYGPQTPGVARFQSRERYGALWTFGLKGIF